MANPIIECNFNIFNEGRRYSGHHRDYVLEAVRDVSVSNPVLEQIKLRESFGYLGHGVRIWTKKLRPSETEIVTLPNGRNIVIECIPSNLTTELKVHDNGDITHKQEILVESDPGKKLMGMYRSKVGGFSWACNQTSPVKFSKRTEVDDFAGFDYVKRPGFATNRGYDFVMESADNVMPRTVRNIVLENIESTGVSSKDAESFLETWENSDYMMLWEMEKRLTDKDSDMDMLMESINKLENYNRVRERIITECAEKMTIVPPDGFVDAMISMSSSEDFETVYNFFMESASTEIRHLPLPGNPFQPILVEQTIEKPFESESPDKGQEIYKPGTGASFFEQPMKFFH